MFEDTKKKYENAAKQAKERYDVELNDYKKLPIISHHKNNVHKQQQQQH